MPQIVETDIGDLEFPDDYTQDQMRDILRAKLPSLRERVGKGVVRDLASRFPRDVAVGGAGLLMGAARGWQQLKDYGEVSGIREMGALAALNAPVGEEGVAMEAANAEAARRAKELEATREQRLAQNPLYKFGEQSRQNAREFYETNPLREGSIPAMLSQGVSSIVPMIASGIAGPLAPVVAGTTYGLTAGQQGAEEAITFGHPDKADEAFILFAGLGALSEAALGYPIALLRQIRAARQAGVDPVAFGRTIRQQVAKQGAEGFVREAVQEGTEQAGQNVVASNILGYDPNRPLTQGVPQAAAIGGVVGAGAGVVGGGAMAIDQARASRALEAQIPAMFRDQPGTVEITPAQPQTVSQFFPPTPEQRAAEAAGLPIPLSFPAPNVTAQPVQEPVPAVQAETKELGYTPPATQPIRRSPATETRTSGRDLTAVQPLAVEARPIAGTPTLLPGQPEAAVNAPQPEAQQKGETPNAISVGIPNEIPPSQAPEAGAEMVAQIRDAERPALPQTETPQAQGAVVSKPKRKSVTKEAYGDLIEYIEGNIGKIRGKKTAPAGTEGYYGDTYKEAVGQSALRKLFSATGQTPDAVAQSLRDNGRVPDSFTVDDLWDALIAAAKSRKGTRKAKTKESAEIKEQERARIEFEKAALQPREGTTAIPVSDLVVGDTMEIGGQQFTVKDLSFNAETDQLESVELEDGRKFGVQRVSGEQVIHADAGSVKQAPVEFLPPTPAPQSKTPKLREGENQGDLISSTQREDFALVGEKAVDFERQAREKAKAEQDAAEAKAKQDREQGTMFSVTLSKPPPSSVTRADVEAAFPSAQGFSIQQFEDRDTGLPAYFVKLPNGASVLINPHEETITFDAQQGASDWGFDPGLAAEGRLIAVGKYFKIQGLKDAAFIDLINTASPADLAHEKFHFLFDMALTGEDRAAILNRYKTEEKAAEAFRRSEGFTRGFWEKMRRFIEWLANLVRGDAFRKLRAPLSTEPSQPTAQDEPKYSLEAVFRSKKSLEDFISKPTISPEEATSLRRQAGTQAGLVPDAIAAEVRSLNPADPIEKRIAPLVDFVLKLHGMAPALELQRVLSDPNIPEDTKQAAISGILLQIEHVRVQTNTLEETLQEANAKLSSAIRNGKKITAERLVEARAKQIADNLITRYRAYLTAQAANLPANQNLAAARAAAIRGLQASVAEEEKYPDQMRRAIEAIAARIDELPVAQGPQAVIDAIRSKGILKGKISDTTIDLLTAEVGGFQPLLLNPTANQMLIELANLQTKSETYVKQIEVIEKALQGKAPGSPSATSRFEGEPTPVELKKFAETYRKFRNTQTDAAKAIREMDQQIREADDDVQVYGRSHDILMRLQNDPQFRQQFETAVNRPGGEIFRDIITAKNPELEKEYTSPLVQTNEEGKQFQNKYRVYLAPDRVADEATLRDMQMLVAEIDEFLQGEVNPVERQTWETRRDYIAKYLLQPKFSQKTPILQFGRVNLNPFSVVQLVAGGRARGPRSELEKMAFRAANEANTTFRVADQAQTGYKLISNNREFGDEATKVATLKAVASHGWDVDRIRHWDETVLNPILASGQAAGQMRLKAGDFIPGTGVRITKEDMEVAQKEKRYSQGVVQTTQGTAKGLPGLLVENPILIKTAILGRNALRGAISPGPFTMARRFSTWSRLFANAWTKAAPEGRRRMVTDGEHFDKAVLGYVSTTNPEFESDSPLKPVYETFAAEAKENEEYQVQSLDQLLERLAAIAVDKGLFPSVEEALPQIEERLLSEVGHHVAAIQKHFEEEGYTDDTPQTVMQYASAKSAFTTARKNMLAPDPYYDYTLTHGSDRIGFVAAAYQQFQLRQIDALKALQLALEKKEGEFAEEVGRLKYKGMSARKAEATVQKKSETQLDRTRFSMLRLHAHKRVIDKVLKDLSENVIDVRDPNDSIVLTALQRVTQNLSSSLLSSPTAIANNLFGGIAANSVILRNLGRASLVGTPIKATAHTTGALVKKVLLTFAPKTAIGKVARSNMPVVKDMAAMVDNQLRNWTQQYLEMQERGLVAPTDMRNRMRAQAALKTSAGAIERNPAPMVAAVPNWLESIPGMRQFLGHLRDKVPRLGDEVVNMGAAGLQTSEVFDFLKTKAVDAFEAREAAGDDINATDYFTTEQNLLSPKELGMVESTGYRDADSLRQMFEIVGNIDGFLRDYYNRQKAAPEGEKHTVPLFENPADEGAVLYDMNAHGNIPTPGFTPPSMAGVGQRGLIKKMLFMFQNYVLRQAAQAERLADKDLRDPKGWREAYALWGIFATLIVWAIAGMLATETGVPATKLITGRSPSRVTAANVIADPDAAMLARYVGMALGNNLPYYGQVISQMLGNPGYGSKWDAANLIPIAGLVRDVNTAVTRIGQTGDPVFPAVDFLNRWLPPVSPALRLLPGVEGDIEARNAARALRVVGPSAGMELAGGGGGQSAQTPASAAVRRLLSAAYRGDQEGIRAAFDDAVREKTEQGSPDPERSVLQSLASAVPARRVFGKSITPAEEAQLRGMMSGGQRAAYGKSQDAFDLINQTLGTKLNLTNTPRARTRGQATRRALADSATPIFASRRSRRRRLGGRRRSAFRRLQIRGSSRRRRRSPARTSFAA